MLKWYGHVTRREQESVGRRVMGRERQREAEVDGQHQV